jgi:hypothetical protein
MPSFDVTGRFVRRQDHRVVGIKRDRLIEIFRRGGLRPLFVGITNSLFASTFFVPSE